MATSETEICNLALSRLGQRQRIYGGSTVADECALHYPLCRDATLRAHPWNFAIRRATLAQDATTPNHEFDYRHALPTDCLKVIRTSWEAEGFYDTEYRIEGRFLLCNEATAKIEYVARITDPAQFDELFTDVLAQRLAAELAVPVTDNHTLAEKLLGVYQTKLAEARSVDAQEGTPRAVVDTSPWITARLG